MTSRLLTFTCIPFILWAGPQACNETPQSEQLFQPGRAQHNTGKIDISAFTKDPAIRHRVSEMPFGEMAARLGSLRFEAQTRFTFSQGGSEYEQEDTYTIVHDASENFRVNMVTPRNAIDFYLIGEDVYIRQDKGQMRQKPRRQVNAEQWEETAFAVVRETLALFHPRLSFSDPAQGDVYGRAATGYRLGLSDPQPDAAKPAPPTVAPARWREVAQPLDLEGRYWVDNETGAFLKAELAGRLDVVDREVRPTQLLISLQAAVLEVARVKPLQPPEAVPEYKRTVPPRDLVSFFRPYLPEPAPEEEQKQP